ncbi:MAG: hypothetical protein AB7O62_24695 [Pirellulales bacterium]
MRVTILYNTPALLPDDPDYASEAGVLESVEAAEAALRSAGHEVARLGTGSSAAMLLKQLEEARPDVVVNFCEGFAGSPAAEPDVASLLQLLHLPYTGSGPECLSLVRHKARTKWMLRGAGLPTAEFLVLPTDGPLPLAELERLLALGPAIVKPAAEDASLGLGVDSVVTEMPSLQRQVAAVRGRYGETLVERFIAGREFNAAIAAVPNLQSLPLAEIEFQAVQELPWNIVTYDAKWDSGGPADLATAARCPAQASVELTDRVQAAALAAFQLTGCRDYARVDVRVSPAEEIFILEINGNPDLAPTAGLARAIRASGMSYDEFILRLVETAARRASPV